MNLETVGGQQQNNRSDNKRITFLGETKTVSEWAEVLGIKKHTLYSRLSKAKSELPASGTYYGGQISEDEIIDDKIIPDSSSSNVREEELWEEAEDIFDKHTVATGGGYEADSTDRSGFFSELQSRFHITKKL